MNLLSRVAKLEQRSLNEDLKLIVVHGGLADRSTTFATIGGQQIECGENEPMAAFHQRCRAQAKAAGERFVILGGLPE